MKSTEIIDIHNELSAIHANTPYDVLRLAAIRCLRGERVHGLPAWDYTPDYVFAMVAALSVLKRCADPQGKAAAERDTVSNSGCNPVMLALKRDAKRDVESLRELSYALWYGEDLKVNKRGDWRSEVVDKSLVDAVNAAITDTLTDGMDVVNESWKVLAELAKLYDNGDDDWLDRIVTVERKRKVRSIDGIAPAPEYVDVAVAQLWYRGIRAYIQSSRAMQTDPRNGYTYIEDVDPDGTVIYWRFGKYEDIGGYDCNGMYTGSYQTAFDIDSIVKSLNLTTKQDEILRLRLRGYTYGEIAEYLGVKRGTIQTHAERIQAKAIERGFVPSDMIF